MHATVIELGAIAAMVLGSYLLARSFDAGAPWAALAAVLVPAVGFTAAGRTAPDVTE